MPTTLAPMREAEFGRFREQDLANADGLWPSPEAARREFDKAFPEGILTPGQHLLTVHADGVAAGYAWLKTIERPIGTEAFLMDFAIYPEHRRRGHGLRALRALEDYVRDLGLETFSLSVRSSNAAAQALYEKAGFSFTFFRMSKKVGAS